MNSETKLRYITMKPSTTCKWFNLCPLRKFEKGGRLDLTWRKKYCESHWNQCVRYQMEERNEHHPDWMLPDGSLCENLMM